MKERKKQGKFSQSALTLSIWAFLLILIVLSLLCSSFVCTVSCCPRLNMLTTDNIWKRAFTHIFDNSSEITSTTWSVFYLLYATKFNFKLACACVCVFLLKSSNLRKMKKLFSSQRKEKSFNKISFA